MVSGGGGGALGAFWDTVRALKVLARVLVAFHCSIADWTCTLVQELAHHDDDFDDEDWCGTTGSWCYRLLGLGIPTAHVSFLA